MAVLFNESYMYSGVIAFLCTAVFHKSDWSDSKYLSMVPVSRFRVHKDVCMCIMPQLQTPHAFILMEVVPLFPAWFFNLGEIKDGIE